MGLYGNLKAKEIQEYSKQNYHTEGDREYEYLYGSGEGQFDGEGGIGRYFK